MEKRVLQASNGVVSDLEAIALTIMLTDSLEAAVRSTACALARRAVKQQPGIERTSKALVLAFQAILMGNGPETFRRIIANTNIPQEHITSALEWEQEAYDHQPLPYEETLAGVLFRALTMAGPLDYYQIPRRNVLEVAVRTVLEVEEEFAIHGLTFTEGAITCHLELDDTYEEEVTADYADQAEALAILYHDFPAEFTELHRMDVVKAILVYFIDHILSSS